MSALIVSESIREDDINWEVFNKNLKGKIESSIGYNWHKGTWP
jgi:hypothetical protein